MDALGDAGDGDPEALLGNLENLVEGVDMEQMLLLALQSSLDETGGLSADALEELGREFPNFDFAELLQQLQNEGFQENLFTETEEQLLPPPTSNAGSDHTSVIPLKNEPSPCVVPSPADQEIEIVDLADDDDVVPATTQNNGTSEPSNLTIIKTEGGITVCHGGGGDLRPKKPTMTDTEVSAVLQKSDPMDVKPAVVKLEPKADKVKMEPTDPPRHHHKDKKKDKDKDKDREREREKEKERHKEEKERKKREKQEKQEKERKLLEMKPPRHPMFLKNRKKFGLVDTSVTLIKIDSIIPVAKHMRLKRRKLTHIEEVDRKKQTQINNKAGRIRMVPRPRPAFEYEIETNKRRHSDSKSKDESKRKKTRIFSSSESDEDDEPSTKKSKGNTSSKKKDKSKPHGEFSATGARILPFEKGRSNQLKEKEQERIIKRPKMPEPTEVKKEVKKDRVFNHNEESAKKLDSILKEAIAKQKAQMRLQDQQFKIPKANAQSNLPVRQSELDIGRSNNPLGRDVVSTTTPLRLLRQEEKRHFDQNRKYAPNSYGQFKQQQEIGGGTIDGGMGVGSSELSKAETERIQQARALEEKVLMRAEFDNIVEDVGAEMHDYAGSDDNEDVVIVPQGPLTSICVGPLAKNVCEMLARRVSVPYPTTVPATPFVQPGAPLPKEPSLADVTIQKCAWWFQGIEKQVSFTAILSQPFNPETDDNAPMSDDGNETVSSFGHVSNPGKDMCQINEVTSTDQHHANLPDVKAEFCGAALIDASFRIAADDKFQRVLDCPRGTNYDRPSFSGTCTICKVKLKSKAELGAHVKSEDHRANFKKISLTIMPNYDRERRHSEDIVERVSRNPVILSSSITGKETPRASVRNGGGSTTSSKNAKRDKEDLSSTERRRSRSPQRKRRSRSRSPADPDRHRRRSPHHRRRTRSRSPRRSRSRSRSPRRRRSSPRRRSTSAEKVAKFLERTRRSRSPSDRKRRASRSKSRSPKVRLRKGRKQPPIFSEKLKLQAAGKWLPHHEERWKIMEEEEKALEKEVAGLRELVCDRPDEHPDYEIEWQAYWKKTYNEVELQGLNAETYDYVPGWKTEWARRAEELIEQMHFDKLGEIRTKHGMDLISLQRLLLDIPVVPRPMDPNNGIILQQQPPMGPPAQPPPPGVSEVYSPFDDDLMPRAMSLSNSSTGGEPAPPGIPVDPLVTIDTVQKTWALLTGQTINPNTPAPPKSNLSGSTGGLDLEMELIEVLRLMNSLEDQLSILAPQVEEYFKRAETMERISSRKSYDLLEDKDFVALLFQCRDKFMSLIRANILTREVLKRMNKAVFGLTSLLDSEPCQRLRPKQPKEVVELEVASTVPAPPAAPAPPPAVQLPREPPPNFDLLRRPRAPHDDLRETLATTPARQFDLSKDGWEIMNRIRNIFGESSTTWEQRFEVGAIIAESIAAKPVVMTDREVIGYIDSLLEPALKILHARNREQRRPPSPPGPNPFRISLESQREFVRGVGTALPRYPELQCRVGTPPVRGHMVQHFQPVRGGMRPPLLGMGPRMPHYNGPPQFYPDGALYRPPPPGSSRARSNSPRQIRGSNSPSHGKIRASHSASPIPRGVLGLSPARIRGSLSPAEIPSLLACNITPPRELHNQTNGKVESPSTNPWSPQRSNDDWTPTFGEDQGPSPPKSHDDWSPTFGKGQGQHDDWSPTFDQGYPTPKSHDDWSPSFGRGHGPPLPRSKENPSPIRQGQGQGPFPPPVSLMELDCSPGPSRLLKESENIPPRKADLSEPWRARGRNDRQESETMRDETGSVVSSGSFGSGGDQDVKTNQKIELKKGSRSTLSNGSGCSGHRSKLKELNYQNDVPVPAEPASGELHDDLSDVESGEIVSSSEDAVSVSSSVQGRRRKLKETLHKLAQDEKAKRKKEVNKPKEDLEKWFERIRPVRSPAGSTINNSTRRGRRRSTSCSSAASKDSRSRMKKRKEKDRESRSDRASLKTSRKEKRKVEKQSKISESRKRARRNSSANLRSEKNQSSKRKRRRRREPSTSTVLLSDTPELPRRRNRQGENETSRNDNSDLDSVGKGKRRRRRDGDIADARSRRRPSRSKSPTMRRRSRPHVMSKMIGDEIQDLEAAEDDYYRRRETEPRRSSTPLEVKPRAPAPFPRNPMANFDDVSEGEITTESSLYCSTRPAAVSPSTKLERRRQRFGNLKSRTRSYSITESLGYSSHHDAVSDSELKPNRIRQAGSTVSTASLKTNNHPPPIPALDEVPPVIDNRLHNFEVVSSASSMSSPESLENFSDQDIPEVDASPNSSTDLVVDHLLEDDMTPTLGIQCSPKP